MTYLKKLLNLQDYDSHKKNTLWQNQIKGVVINPTSVPAIKRNILFGIFIHKSH